MSRPGRKRKAGKREPNGKPSRIGHRILGEQDAMSVAVDYRQRVFGIPNHAVLDQKAATMLGRLCMQGEISNTQWEAGEEWARLLNARYAAINAPRGFKTATGGRSPMTDERDEHNFRTTKAELDAANNAVSGYGQLPPVQARERFEALRMVIIEQLHVPHLHGSLRVALNGLARHFGLEGQRAA